MLRLSLLCSKIDLLFFPKFPKILTHYSYFIPISSPIIPTCSCNFYCINDNNVMVTITLENRMLSAQTFLWNIAAFKYIFTNLKKILGMISLPLPIVTSNYSCIILVNILLFQNNSRILLIKIATYYSQNYAGILGSGLHIGQIFECNWPRPS